MASILAARVTKVVEITGETPGTATVRKLTGKQLGKAQEAFRAGLFALMREQVELQKEHRALMAAMDDGSPKADAEPEKAAAATEQRSPLAGFDPATLVLLGVAEWSYDDAITAEVIEAAADDVVEQLAAAVLRLSKPGLFESKAESEAAQKNG